MLFSLTPDTWRRTFSENSGMEQSPFEELDSSSRAMREYSASYYLLVFQREDTHVTREKPMPRQKSRWRSASLPDFEE